jgi:hypothetical protein
MNGRRGVFCERRRPAARARGKTFSILLHDHIIVGWDGYASLKRLRLI